jgi:hypothetical protein
MPSANRKTVRDDFTSEQRLHTHRFAPLACAEERVRQEMRGGAMETYKLVVVVVKPFVDANMWRKGLAQRLSNLEERTQEVQTIATVIPIGCYLRVRCVCRVGC